MIYMHLCFLLIFGFLYEPACLVNSALIVGPGWKFSDVVLVPQEGLIAILRLNTSVMPWF